MNTVLQDLRYALRNLSRNPGFTAVIVLTLAIGIGANTTVFSFVNAVFLKPLPYPEPDQLVQLWGINRTLGIDGGVSVPNFLDWQRQSEAFSGLAAYRFDQLTLSGQGEPERVTTIRTSPDFLSILGAQPLQGRAFAPAEYLSGGLPVVVLSHGAWQRRYGGQVNIVGTRLTFDGQPHTVVGVLPASFQVKFPFCGQGHAALPEPEFWLPLTQDASGLNRGVLSLRTLARLKPGVTLERAQAEMKTVASRLEQQYPDTNKGWEVLILPLHELKTNAGVAGPILLTPVVLVLLIACVNVTNMLLARATNRRREIAIRLALGASQVRLMRQLLTESLLFASLGGGLGILFARWGCDFIKTMLRESVLVLPNVGVDGSVAGYTALISLFTGVMVGLVPALHGCRLRLNEFLQQGASTLAGGFAGQRFSRVLVVTELTLALVLLSATGLLLRSLSLTWKVDLGFRCDRVLAMDIALAPSKYAEPHQQAVFFEQLLQRVESHPGIQAAALISGLPTASWGNTRFRIQGRPQPSGDGWLGAGFSVASRGYFEVMTIPLKKGRVFTESDGERAPGVALVNEAMARKHWPESSPVGATLDLAGKWVTVVGVVGDVRRPHIAGVLDARPELFVPYQQWPSARMSLVVKRSLADPARITSAVKGEVSSLDPYQAVANVQSLEKAVSKSMAVGYLILSLMGLFAFGALLLAAIGVYGLIAYTVSRRTQEIGLRMALGARRDDVVRMVLGQGTRLLLWGLGLGLPLSLAVGKLLAGLFYGVGAIDPPVLLGVSVLLTAMTLLACCFPARRAAKVDPMVALRYE